MIEACYNCDISLTFFPEKLDSKPSFSSVSSVQLISRIWLFATPWTAACQASLYSTISWNMLTLMSIKSVMPSNQFIPIISFSCLQSCTASGSFQISQFFLIGGQSIGVSASASVLPMNIQDWFPLGDDVGKLKHNWRKSRKSIVTWERRGRLKFKIS